MTRYPLRVIPLTAVVLLATAPARGDDLSSTLRMHFQNRLLGEAISPDGRVERESGVDRGMLRGHFHRSAVSDSATGGFLSSTFSRLYGIERVEVSPMRVMVEHAEVAASLALFASAIGTSVGAWDEEASLYLIGAAAAAGVLWGGTRADDPRVRVRYRWEP